jgi:MFS family permease
VSTRSVDVRNYVLVTGAYWADTITDGAARVLVLFYFYTLGYSPFEIASLFLFYEVFGIVTNLVGGWLAAKLGLRTTLIGGLSIQLVGLGMLAFAPAAWLVVPYVMTAQALSGIAKDLTKMSSKSAVKLLVPDEAHADLYRWVSLLTGSKNALKGVGFFLGGLLLTVIGFRSALFVLLTLTGSALVVILTMMRGHLGTPDRKAKFRGMFSNNRSVNILAAARIFLFASRDVWFVVGLPVYLESVLGWSFWQAGGFLAIWVIGYGSVQASAPKTLRRWTGDAGPTGTTATRLAFVLAAFPALIALGLSAGLSPTAVLVVGLIAFGVVFALNSAVHSFLILRYAEGDKVAMNVGFYYMANACGRLAGTVLSGALYQWHGLEACLWASAVFLVVAALLSGRLPDARAARAARGHREAERSASTGEALRRGPTPS